MQSLLHLYFYILYHRELWFLGMGTYTRETRDVSNVVSVFAVIQLGVLNSITKTKCQKYSSFRRTLLQGWWLRPLCLLHPRSSLRHSVPWIGWHLGAVWLRERRIVLEHPVSWRLQVTWIHPSFRIILLHQVASYRVSSCWSTICFRQRLSYADVTGLAQSVHRLSVMGLDGLMWVRLSFLTQGSWSCFVKYSFHNNLSLNSNSHFKKLGNRFLNL